MVGVNRIVAPDRPSPRPPPATPTPCSARAPARLLHTAGVVGVSADGSVPDELAEQAAVVWENIAAILAEAGMAVTDIVSMTTYVVAGEDLAPVMAARDAAMGDHLAASTLVTVPALARPAWRGGRRRRRLLSPVEYVCRSSTWCRPPAPRTR